MKSSLPLSFVIKTLCLAAALSLTACGGGGDDGQGAQTQVAQPAAVPDVTFTNVATNPAKTKVMFGEQDIEVAAFRMVWKDQNHASIGQLVFENKYQESLWKTFKSFRLVDNDGVDVNREARYSVRFDDAKHQIIVDFYAWPWFANDFGVVPKVYSLLANMDVSVPEGTKFSLALKDVQMHDAGKEFVSQVIGGEMKVMSVAGLKLPIITSSSQAYSSVNREMLGVMMPVGSFVAECPADSTDSCILMDTKFEVFGISAPLIETGGNYYGSQQVFPEISYLFSSPFSYGLSIGEKRMFTIYGAPQEMGFSVRITEMTWLIGGKVRVSPVIPATSADCNLLVADWRGCKG